MRILLATDLYKPSVNGVVTSTVSLKKSLEGMGHEVRVLTLAKYGYIDRNKHVYAVSSINVNKLYPGARVKFFSDKSVLNHIIKWNPDIVHTQSEFSTFRMAKQIAHYLDIPFVHTYHTIYEDYTHYFSPHKKMGRQIVSLFSKRLLNETEAVIVPTKKVDQILREYEVTQSITIIPSGIQLKQFKQVFSKEEMADLRRRFDIPKDAFLLISLGRLGKEKNIEEILDFLSLLKQKGIYFLIVGDGPNKEALMKKVKFLDLEKKVRFAGMVNPEHVARYYQAADVFVCASTSETQGLTYIEALASGIPALCRADQSIENVIINGETGYSYHHFKEFESCLYVLMHDHELYQKIAQQGQELVFQNYSSEAFGTQVMAVYKEALTRYYTNQMMQMNL